MKGQNIKKKKINEGDSTWCLKLTENKPLLFHYRAKEAEKLIGFAKTHDELIIDIGGRKRNQIQQHFIYFIRLTFEKTAKN